MTETANNMFQAATEEYKILWDYYKQTQLERRSLYEWYFKIIVLPTAIIGFLGSNNLSFTLPQSFLAGFLAIVFLAGFSVYIAYVTESASSAKYYNDINNLRKAMIAKLGKDCFCFFNVDYKFDRKARIFSIKFYKSLTIPILNSGVDIFALNCSAKLAVWHNILIFIVLIAVHIVTYIKIFNQYSNYKHTDDMET